MNGTTFAHFHICGNNPRLKQFVKIILSGRTNAPSLNFIILTDISSQPCALLGLSDRMILIIFSSEMKKSVNNVVLAGVPCGISLPVSMIVH